MLPTTDASSLWFWVLSFNAAERTERWLHPPLTLMTAFAESVGTTLRLSRCYFSLHAVIPLLWLCKTELVSQKAFRTIRLVEPTCWLNLVVQGLQNQTFWVNSISCWLPAKFEGLNISHLLPILKKCGEVKMSISKVWKCPYKKAIHNDYEMLLRK